MQYAAPFWRISRNKHAYLGRPCGTVISGPRDTKSAHRRVVIRRNIVEYLASKNSIILGNELDQLFLSLPLFAKHGGDSGTVLHDDRSDVWC